MEKYSLFRGVDAGGFPLIHRVEPGTGHGLDATAGLGKTASSEHLPEVMELVEAISPQPGCLYLVNSALGAGEYVGCNLRGDWFTEAGLNHTPPGWEKIPVWDIDQRRRVANTTQYVRDWGNLAWGYPTFYNAHRFRHHVNQDPERAYGYILGAFWDPRMRRVILVSELVREMCERLGALHIYDRIEKGEFPDSSMGSKVPFDVCLICGNVARTPALYCKHVNDADPNYGKRKILPDGRICGMRNDHPRFFDDSFVFVGADRSAKVMSNLTPLVRGQNAYTRTIYPFTPGTKTASAPPTEQQERDQRLMGAAGRVLAAQKDPSAELATQLDHALQGIQVGNPREKAALRYFSERRKANSLSENGRLPSEQREMLELLNRRRLSLDGIDPDEFAHLDAELERRTTKRAAHAKWAEMLKRIPSAYPHQLSVVRAHADEMPTLPPGTLQHLGDLPALSAAARLGVILKPEEFQYAVLCREQPEMARQLWESGSVFTATTPDTTAPPGLKLPPPAAETLARILSLLQEVLASRSFAPTAVRIRLMSAGPASDPLLRQEVDSPLLQKISSLYNGYRSALLENPPDWRSIPLGPAPMEDLLEESKLASTSQELSHQLLCLAYWSAVPVGW